MPLGSTDLPNAPITESTSGCTAIHFGFKVISNRLESRKSSPEKKAFLYCPGTRCLVYELHNLNIPGFRYVRKPGRARSVHFSHFLRNPLGVSPVGKKTDRRFIRRPVSSMVAMASSRFIATEGAKTPCRVALTR